LGSPEQLSEYKRRREALRITEGWAKNWGCSFCDEVGPGLPLWTPKGTVFHLLEDFLKQEQVKQGYQPVVTGYLKSQVTGRVQRRLVGDG